MSKGFASSYRIVLLATALLLCFGAFGVRLVWLHVVDREKLLAAMTRTRDRFTVEKARRGDILDDRGVKLATSHSMMEVGVDPSWTRPQDEAKWPQLARLIGLPLPELEEKFRTKFRPARGAATRVAPPAGDAATRIALAFGASPPAAADAVEAEDPEENDEAVPDETGQVPIRWAKLKEVSESEYDQVEKLGIRGVYGRRIYRRVYPNNQLAAHVIGYVNKEQQPVAGMEFFADFYLRAQNGWRISERDGRNRELPQFQKRAVPAADGFSVRLSIKSAVQDVVEQELALIAEKFRPIKATIIVSDPRTGFILGMGNYPTFDPNEYNKVPKEEMARMKNAAVADVYEPGSVFKIVPIAAALEERLATPETKFDCTLDKIVHRNRLVGLPAEDHRFDHDLTVREIMAKSSNKGSAQLAIMMGEERFNRYARAFGFGRTLGFPVGGEVPGLFSTPDKWVPIDITRIAIGHTIAATALQMHQAMGVIASGGVLLRPQVVREIRDPSGEVIFHRQDGIELERVISPRTAEKVAEMLVAVTSKQGTAPEAAIVINGLDYQVAGKTGTTQKLVEEPHPRTGEPRLVYTNKKHIASFVGFFPASNPQVAISVIVDEAHVETGSRTAYGRVVAAPSFRNLGLKLIPILDIKTPQPAARPSLFAASEGGLR